MKISKFIISLALVINTLVVSSQNETSKWYFGNKAALDFMSGPPTPMFNSAMIAGEGSASIADGSGNLLFYANALTIYNKLHVPMANGTGMAGGSSTQPVLIIKQPGSSSLYYVFHQAGLSFLNNVGLSYSIVDMSLASGNGSVTVKNSHLFGNTTTNLMSEKLTATKHCNGVDIWILTHEFFNNNFQAYLLSSSGLNINPVISSVGTIHSNWTHGWMGQMKVSPNGKKIAVCVPQQVFEIFDFNSANGIVSNPLTLSSSYGLGYCEFSPDNSKLYGIGNTITNGRNLISQWNLCATSASAIIASRDSIVDTVIVGNLSILRSLQLAKDGKIYVARTPLTVLGVINNPNAILANCNYVSSGVSVAPNYCFNGFPSFMSSSYNQPQIIPPFTYTIDCNSVQFSVPNFTTGANVCFASSNTVTSIMWDFGDPPSGSANNSILNNPIHSFSSPGTYTVKMIVNFNCSSDTIQQTILVNPSFSISVNISPSNCYSNGTATAVILGGQGQFSYAWSPSSQTTPIATNLASGVYTLSISTSSNCIISKTFTISQINTMSVNVNTTSINCANNGVMLSAEAFASGAIGSYSYLWSIGNQTTSLITGLSPGNYSVSINNQFGCSASAAFQISLPVNLQVSTLTPVLVCENQQTTLNANIHAINYLWSGPNNFSQTGQNVVLAAYSANVAGTYTLITSASNNCISVYTLSVFVSPLPKIKLSTSKNNLCAPYCSLLSLETISAGAAIIQSNFALDNKTLEGYSINKCFTAGGNYTLSASCKDTNNCINFSSLIINAYPKPIADFDFVPAKPIAEFEKVEFLNASYGDQQINWKWFINDLNTLYSPNKNTSYTFQNSGTFPVVLITENTWGCSDTIQKTITVFDDLGIYVPNSFTPNGDGINETFFPKGFGITEYKLEIYDRWGEIIFFTKDLFSSWDGTYKGIECKTDVYVWKISAKNIKGKVKNLTGHVTLLK
ncbi:MAG: gliding motility-associated C-terminal domain-containing protein [Bacteroidia bacterium]|nr:gliding motility-associated C-terminal domain-containing protein [Bacteroidia bacterium]